jgi:hypothetical protein
MFDFLHALPGDIEFALGCFIGFFDEAMQDDDALPNQRAEKCAPDSFLAFGAYLEKSVTHCPRIRHPKIRTEFYHAQGDAREAGIDSGWPFQHGLLNVGIEKLEGTASKNSRAYFIDVI